MPIVNKKHYAYSKKGIAAAKREARRTGQPIKRIKKVKPKSRR